MGPVVLAQAVMMSGSRDDGGGADWMGLTGVMWVVVLLGGVGAQMEASDATGSAGSVAAGIGCAVSMDTGDCVGGDAARRGDVVRCAVGIGAETTGMAGAGGRGIFHNGDGSVCVGGCRNTGATSGCACVVGDVVGCDVEAAVASLFVTGADGVSASGSSVGADGVTPCSSSFFRSNDSMNDLINVILCFVSATLEMRSL